MKLINTFCISILFTISLFSQETIIIPDIGFEEALIDLNIDTNGLNGNILVSDARYVVNLNINTPLENKLLPNVNSKIKSLSGIEHFPNLKRLDCYGNEITKLDLSKNTEITFLNCSDNKIETLDLSNNPNLFSVSCDNNKLTSLKLGDKPSLRDLYCNDNRLTELNIKNCTALENFDASNNKIQKILINKETYSKYSEGWYKDSSVAYLENMEASAPIQITKVESTPKTTSTPKTITTEKSNQSTETAANYYEKFQLSVITEYDKLLLAPSHLDNKKLEVQQKYNLDGSQFTQWIAEYSNLTNTNKTVIKTNTAVYFSKFKHLAVNEYEKLVLNPSYLQSKKEEIQQKYNLNPGDLTKWIDQFGTPSLKAKTIPQKESTESYYLKFKKSVVGEYEKLVLNHSYTQSVKSKIQQKYNITASQLSDWIVKHSKVKAL